MMGEEEAKTMKPIGLFHLDKLILSLNQHQTTKLKTKPSPCLETYNT
jgi:hypothetical protein